MWRLLKMCNYQLSWFLNPQRKPQTWRNLHAESRVCHMTWLTIVLTIRVQKNKRFLLVARWLAIRSADCNRRAPWFTLHNKWKWNWSVVIQGHSELKPKWNDRYTIYLYLSSLNLRSNGQRICAQPQMKSANWTGWNRNISTDWKISFASEGSKRKPINYLSLSLSFLSSWSSLASSTFGVRCTRQLHDQQWRMRFKELWTKRLWQFIMLVLHNLVLGVP